MTLNKLYLNTADVVFALESLNQCQYLHFNFTFYVTTLVWKSTDRTSGYGQLNPFHDMDKLSPSELLTTYSEKFLMFNNIGSSPFAPLYVPELLRTDTPNCIVVSLISWSSWIPTRKDFFQSPFSLQAVQIHSANGVKLLEAWRGVLSSTPPYKIGLRPRVSVGNKTYK
jgi:hypothetical protein